MTEPMTAERLAEIRRHDAAHNPGDVRSDAPKDAIRYFPETHRRELLAEVDRLKRELADAAPYAEAGKAAAAEQARREYYSGTCEDCSCCTTAQCSEGRCPENSVGESTCPCTCY